MFHIVESCPLTKLNGVLSRLYSADEDTVWWLTSYCSWHAYEKKKKNDIVPEWRLISAIHPVDEDAVSWLTSYGSW